MASFKRRWLAAFVVVGIATAGATALVDTSQAADVAYVINNKIPVTSTDIAHRAAFLRLQHRKGNVNQVAAQEMIDQTLRFEEMRRQGVSISSSQVDAAYQNFASSNKLKTSQLDQILAQAGVTRDHFREFIRAQIGWNKLLSKRYAATASGSGSEQEAVQKMLKNGGVKPSSTEYLLQQVIFVVPDRDRSRILSRRKQEADAMRRKVSGCDSTHDLAKQVLDVTVRNLGRKIEQELPEEWKKQVMEAPVGGATPTHVTDRGVEFIAVCSSRTVSDDRVAQMVYESQDKDQTKSAQDLSDKYTAELRDKATIVKR